MRFVFLIFFWVVTSCTFGQTLSKGIKALDDEKFDKAEDIFRRIIFKDSMQIVAQVGISKVYVKMYQSQNLVQSPVMYKICLALLKKSRDNFSLSSKDDKELLSEKLQVFSVGDVLNIMQDVSSVLWKTYYAYEKSPDSIQVFMDKYCFGDSNRIKAQQLFLELHLNNAKKINTISAYKDIINQFPGTEIELKAKGEIERLEISDALNSGAVKKLEFVIGKYPNSNKLNEIKEQLAKSYFESYSEKSDEGAIKKLISQLSALQTDLADSMIDSCNKQLYKIEYQKVYNSGKIDETRNFILKYAALPNEDLNEMKRKKWELITDYLNNQTEPNFSLLQELIKEVSPSYVGLDELLAKAMISIRKYCVKLCNYKFSEYLTNTASLPEEYHDSFLKFISDNFPVTVHIDSSELYRQFRILDYDDNKLNLTNTLVDSMKILKPSPSVKIYFRFINRAADSHPTNQELYKYVMIRKQLADGKFSKKQIILSEQSDTYTAITLPEIKTTSTFFAALKRKYNINSFSSPELIEETGNGYLANMYGFSSNAKSCCPDYSMSIQFTKQGNDYIPQSLSSLENIDNLNLDMFKKDEFLIDEKILK